MSRLEAIAAGRTAHQTGDWESYGILREAPAAELAKLEDWLNSCKPDHMSDIAGVLSQGGGAGANYNLIVFCKRGSGGLGSVAVSGQPWNGADHFAKNYMVGREIVLLGFVDGKQGDTVFCVIKK